MSNGNMVRVFDSLSSNAIPWQDTRCLSQHPAELVKMNSNRTRINDRDEAFVMRSIALKQSRVAKWGS